MSNNVLYVKKKENDVKEEEMKIYRKYIYKKYISLYLYV